MKIPVAMFDVRDLRIEYVQYDTGGVKCGSVEVEVFLTWEELTKVHSVTNG